MKQKIKLIHVLYSNGNIKRRGNHGFRRFRNENLELIKAPNGRTQNKATKLVSDKQQERRTHV